MERWGEFAASGSRAVSVVTVSVLDFADPDHTTSLLVRANKCGTRAPLAARLDGCSPRAVL